MKVIFAGGGSGGPVSPLLAIYEQLKKINPDIKGIWIGTKNGPEKKMIEPFNLDFRVVASGKLRRYFSVWNLVDPFKILLGIIQSLILLKQEKPDIVLSAGGFSAVPVFISAKLLKIPSITHQQDLQPGLANKIMAKVATKITVTFEKSLKDYPEYKTILISNPVRQHIFQASKNKALKIFNLDAALKTILVVGGGQGATIINQTILKSLKKLLKDYQIIHTVGKGNLKAVDIMENKERYHAYEFLNTEILDAIAAADLVISRAGMSFFSELSVLGKPAIMIPISGHQEVNAQYFAKHNAVKVLYEKNLDSENLINLINNIFNNPSDLANLSRNISQMIDKDAAKKYAEFIVKTLQK